MGSLQKALDLEGGGVVSLVGAGGKTSLMFRLAKEFSDAGESVLSTTTTKIMMPDRHQSPQIILAASPQAVLEKAKKLLKDNCHVMPIILTKLADSVQRLSYIFINPVCSAGLWWKQTAPPKNR